MQSSAPPPPPSSSLPPPSKLFRIALFSFEGTGHVNPMVALGAALQRRGHSVSFICVLDVEKKIKAADLTFIPYGKAEFPLGSTQQHNDAVNQLSGLGAIRVMVDRAVLAVRIQLRELPSIFTSHGPFDILLVDSAQLAPLVVAEHLRIPAVTIDNLPPFIIESSAPPWIFGWGYSEWWGARLRNWVGNQLFLLSLSPLRRVLNERRKEWGMAVNSDANLLWSTRLRLSHIPASLDFPRRWWPAYFHHAGPFISAEVREPVPFDYSRLTDRPLVYASLGTVNNLNGSLLTNIALAFSTLDVQLVLSTGGGLSPASLGIDHLSNVCVVAMAPQIQLIERSVLVVTHCGINTVLETLLAGKPMVAIPIASDQPGNAARLRRLGLAEVIAPPALTVEKLRAAAVRVMGDEGYKQRAVKMQTHLQGLKGLDRGVELIEAELVRSASTTST